MLLAMLIGLLGALGFIVVVLLSSVSAVVGVCQQEAQAQSAPFSSGSGGPGSSNSPGFDPSDSPSPQFVSQNWSESALSDIPADFLTLYEKAAEEYGLDATVLAAVGKVETDHGRYDAPGVTSGENSAGAGGPMQFLAGTWANVGVDGNGDGTKDRYDPEDAIPGAANYLKLEGAPQDYNMALLAYNPSQAYVDDVLAQSAEYRGTEAGGEDDQIAANPTSPSTSPSTSTTLAFVLSSLAARPAYAQDAPGTVGNAGATDYSGPEIDTLTLINNYRQDNGLQPLELSDTISTASAHYAHDMAKYDAYRNPEAHISGPSDHYFEGATLTDRMNEEGYQAAHYGENIAAGQATPQEVFTAWQNSPGHNAMMLNADMNVIGIGFVENPETEYGEFWVTNFGSDPDETTRPVSEAGGGSGGGSGEGSGGGSGSDGGSGGEVRGNSKAVFPLPENYFDSYEDTWGASRGGGRGHEGTDLFAPDGTPIYAVTSGEVVPVSGSDDQGWNELGGWAVMIEASEDVGPVKKGDTLYYAHMLERSPLQPGDTVEAGDVIGTVGSTGEGPVGSILPDGRGEHLHLGWYDPTDARAQAPSGAMNPFPLLEWLRENGGTATGPANVAPGPAQTSVPAYCRPLQALGLVPTSSNPSSDPSGGDGPLAEGTGPSGDGSGSGSGSGSGAQPGRGSATGQQVVEEALKYEGVPYALGGPEICIPYEKMDCTCFTTTVFREFGIELPDAPMGQWEFGEEVTGEPQAGDLHIWGDPGDGTGGHAAIDMGDGRIIHSNTATYDVAVADFWENPMYLGARRLVD